MTKAEAKRLQNGKIRAEGERVVEYIFTHPEAQAEIEIYGTPIDETE